MKAENSGRTSPLALNMWVSRLHDQALSACYPESEVRLAPVRYLCWEVPNIGVPTTY